jgi:hypothetical protein
MSAPIGHTVPAAVPAATAAPDRTADETVYAAVARWAMRASHGRLTAWTVGGAVDALGVALFVRPVWPALWPLALPFGCLASIGAWGLATHRMLELEAAGRSGTARARLYRTVRTTAVVAGTILAVATFYTALGLLLGPSWTL